MMSVWPASLTEVAVTDSCPFSIQSHEQPKEAAAVAVLDCCLCHCWSHAIVQTDECEWQLLIFCRLLTFEQVLQVVLVAAEAAMAADYEATKLKPSRAVLATPSQSMTPMRCATADRLAYQGCQAPHPSQLPRSLSDPLCRPWKFCHFSTFDPMNHSKAAQIRKMDDRSTWTKQMRRSCLCWGQHRWAVRWPAPGLGGGHDAPA